MKPQYTSVWGRLAAEGARPPKKDASTSQAQIVRATIELLDAEGLDALSMRRLGTKLSMGATSIYWYVANKVELLDLAMDEVFGEIALPVGGGLHWQEAASVFAHSLRQALLRHPWAIKLLGSRPSLGPNALILAEKAMILFEDAGFHGPAIDHAVNTLTAYVMGVTASESGWYEMVAATGLSPKQWLEQNESAVVASMAGRPTLHALYERTRESGDLRDDMIDRFAFGLSCVLDGLAARLPR
ncbi:TetR/AcrR family transcriptional regulator C-terminal domain-containing protein [Streptosporangium soli]|nr:TetR/AcrR family transcriptional regulator C-terminal domain-containing protein [Streptosporangium sp. KLBMP 9127]